MKLLCLPTFDSRKNNSKCIPRNVVEYEKDWKYVWEYTSSSVEVIHNGIESILLGHTNGKGGSGGDHGGDVENPSEVGGDEGEIPTPWLVTKPQSREI